MNSKRHVPHPHASPSGVSTFSAVLPGIFAEETAQSRSYSMASRHVHESLELYFLLEGERFYFIDQDTYLVKEGMAVLINRNQIHKTSAANGAAGYRRFLFQIEGPQFDDYFRLLGFTDAASFGERFWGICQFSSEDWRRVLQLIDSIKLTLSPPSQGGASPSLRSQRHNLTVLAMLELLTLYVQNRAASEEERWQPASTHAVHTGIHAKVHEIALYLQSNSGSPLSLEELSRHFFISQSYLTRIFKSVTGFTVVEYQTHCRIQKAKLLLTETAFSITEIAEQTGFGNVTYFERVFRKATAYSPLRYRKTYAKRPAADPHLPDA